MEHRIEFSEGAPCDLARKLIAAGKAHRIDRLVMLRDGKPVLSGVVGWFADRQLQETSKFGPRYVRWKPITDERRQALRAKSSPQAISLSPEPESGSWP